MGTWVKGGIMGQVDVAICVYGKPYNTAVTLASLIEHSRQHIGRVFIQQEKEQPYDETVDYLPRCFPELDIVRYVPAVHIGLSFADLPRARSNAAYRLSLRYQFAWENSTKDFLFIIHNDCLFKNDIVGDMMTAIGDEFVGVGSIGQCWNCPANFAGVCDGDRHDIYQPSFEQIAKLLDGFPGPRTDLAVINRVSPMPLPECRLNEFACLINLRTTRPDVYPNGPIPPLGSMTTDIGTTWFRELRLAGRRFRNWPGNFEHAPFSRQKGGHPALSSQSVYDHDEAEARAFLRANYPKTFDRVDVLRSVARALRGFVNPGASLLTVGVPNA